MNKEIIAFVDGSYNHPLKRYSFGCIMFEPDDEDNVSIHGGSNDFNKVSKFRNVAGEILGAVYAVTWAIKNGYKKITIYYDYIGIEKWAAKEWKRNNDLTKEYSMYMSEASKQIDISFVKVAAHTGIQHNEAADLVAKKALEVNLPIPKIDFSLVIMDLKSIPFLVCSFFLLFTKR